MSHIALKQALLLFAAPASWFALLGLVILIAQTPWGASGGHFPIVAALFIWSLLAAPIFGLAGGTYAIMRKVRYSPRIVTAAMVTSMCVLVGGIFLWMEVLWRSGSIFILVLGPLGFILLWWAKRRPPQKH